MKILYALGAIQIVLILYVVGNINESASSSRQRQDDQLADYSSQRQVAVDPYSASTNLDEARLRQIIREELAQLLSAHVPLEEMSALGGTEPVIQYSRDEIALSIDELKGIGEVSSQEMLALEAKIVTLGETDRRQMMGKLFAAVKSGDIEARFQ